MTKIEITLLITLIVLVIIYRYLHLRRVKAYLREIKKAWDAFTNEQQRHMESRSHLSGELGKAAKLKELDERMISRLLKENEQLTGKNKEIVRLNAELVALASKLDPNGHGVIVTSVAGGGCSLSLLPANKEALSTLLFIVDKLKSMG